MHLKRIKSCNISPELVGGVVENNEIAFQDSWCLITATKRDFTQERLQPRQRKADRELKAGKSIDFPKVSKGRGFVALEP